MPSFASSLLLICRSAMPALLVCPGLASAGNSDASEAGESALPKVRAFLALADDQDQPLRPAHATGGVASSPRWVLTMHADMSPQTSMLFERSRAASLSEPSAARLNTAPATRVGFEFRPVSAGNALKPIGALRVQMSDNSTLSFRPRRNGVLVSWRSQF